MSELLIRPACEDDCRLFWEWANDPDTRQASFSTGFIPWETHVAWFTGRLNDPCYRMYVVAASSGDPVAHVRFELDGDRAVVSITVGPSQRGKGYGRAALRLACAALFASTNAARVDAYIKPGNDASLGAFGQANFIDKGAATIKGQRALYMSLKRPVSQE